ncbi:MAG: 2Fe-2S iron-sulfur cluster-binding protein [Porticoccaceae bacterium]|jgi:2Fe-2S ferredoxin|nr:2Fe-2S iron-sulfur cluster-binding protein [Porticoccaceae bacterium]MEA3299049.1 2Fe-2S iron-sulfur cluster-binding protein [Pseudomonadota bacterium]HLS97324.1 2Fe-2S iron-sulfur cluster-binding protein [Porticoccaceae bacterium]
MATVTFIDPAGTAHEVNIENGTSLMQAALDNGIDGIVAECGGACSCATCHCYIDSAWVAKVTPPSSIEKDMLECVIDPQDNSRLSCQVFVSDELDGLVVTIPQAQY